jgi:hypothetical protein
MDGSNVYVFQFFMYAVLSGQWLSFLCCSLRLCMMSDLRVYHLGQLGIDGRIILKFI